MTDDDMRDFQQNVSWAFLDICNSNIYNKAFVNLDIIHKIYDS